MLVYRRKVSRGSEKSERKINWCAGGFSPAVIELSANLRIPGRAFTTFLDREKRFARARFLRRTRERNRAARQCSSVHFSPDLGRRICCRRVLDGAEDRSEKNPIPSGPTAFPGSD